MTAEKLPIIYLHWRDSAHHGEGWQHLNNLKYAEDVLLYESVGFLLKETEYSYVIIQSKNVSLGDEFDNVDSVMEIPKKAIMLVEWLQVKVE